MTMDTDLEQVLEVYREGKKDIPSLKLSFDYMYVQPAPLMISDSYSKRMIATLKAASLVAQDVASLTLKHVDFAVAGVFSIVNEDIAPYTARLILERPYNLTHEQAAKLEANANACVFCWKPQTIKQKNRHDVSHSHRSHWLNVTHPLPHKQQKRYYRDPSSAPKEVHSLMRAQHH